MLAVLDSTMTHFHKNLRRRRKRWKVSPLAIVALLSSALIQVSNCHVTGDSGRLNFRELKSDNFEFGAVDGMQASASAWSHVEDSDSNPLEKKEFVSDLQTQTQFNGSRSSRYLKTLQVTQESFDRHFKEQLVCDHHEVILDTMSGSIRLESLILKGCKNLTSLADVIPSTEDQHRSDVINLNISDSSSLTNLNLSGFKSLKQLVLNQTAGAPGFELDTFLPNLEVLVLDSISNLLTVDATYLLSFTPNLRLLSFSNCARLQSVVFSNNTLQSVTGLLVNLGIVQFNDNPNLSTICPWFFRIAPNLSSLSVERCPNLDWNPIFLTDRRFFPSLEELQYGETPMQCDCRIKHVETNSTIHLNLALIEKLRSDLLQQATCLFNGTTISVKNFFNNDNNQLCPISSGNETVLNPVIDFSFFDPYIDEPDVNSSQIAVKDIETSDIENPTVWSTVSLHCHPYNDVDSIFWVTPTNMVFMIQNNSDGHSCQPSIEVLSRACGSVLELDNYLSKMKVYENGTLSISDFGVSQRGVYECFVASGHNGRLAGSAKYELVLDQGYRHVIYNLSLIYGFAVCGAFLLLTLLFKLIHFLLHNYGCCLFCYFCENKLPPKARRLKRAMESIEAYRTQQLEKLRENYTQQSDWIRQNCASQMERVRENYNSQIQNLKDIRLYGNTQLTAVRSQYYEQMSRIRDYSANQLDRVHENYIFQRQRLRKFSAQNYIKVQETRLYTRRTLTKVMENIPTLYLDLTTCKQGLGERQPSIEWVENDDQFIGPENFQLPSYRSRLVREQSDRRSDSVYFTPTGTPTRDVAASWAPGATTSLKNTPTREIDPYKAVYSGNSVDRKMLQSHRRNRSFSQFLPPLPNWLTSSTSANFLAGKPYRDQSREVEVVIEHETNSNDYYLPDDMSTTATTISKSPRSKRNSVPSEDCKPSHGSSSDAMCSSITNDSSQQHTDGSTVPLLAPRRAIMSSMHCVSFTGDRLSQKRLSI